MRYPDFRPESLERWVYLGIIDGWTLGKAWKRGHPTSPRKMYLTDHYDLPFMFRMFLDPKDERVWVERTCAWRTPKVVGQRLLDYVNMIEGW